MEKFNYKPTKPKDASTLIIIRKNKKKTFVLMGQRPMQSGLCLEFMFFLVE